MPQGSGFTVSPALAEPGTRLVRATPPRTYPIALRRSLLLLQTLVPMRKPHFQQALTSHQHAILAMGEDTVLA